MKKILVACEFSATVRQAFEDKGFYVVSCDLLPSEIEGNHYQGDIKDILYDGWDLMIAHPPCTYLSNSGVRHLHSHVVTRLGNRAKIHGKLRFEYMRKACEFFNSLKNAPINRIAIENPIPHKYAKELIGHYDQIIHPYQFGNPETKSICLWLKNLPTLEYTQIIPISERVHKIHNMSPSPNRSKERSRFFPEVAEAMANQWGIVFN